MNSPQPPQLESWLHSTFLLAHIPQSRRKDPSREALCGSREMWLPVPPPHPGRSQQEGLSQASPPLGPGTHRPCRSQKQHRTTMLPIRCNSALTLMPKNRPSLRHLEAGARTEPEGTTQCSFHPSPSQRAVSQLGVTLIGVGAVLMQHYLLGPGQSWQKKYIHTYSL